MNLTSPSKNEIEVSLFGPGVGECAVLHLGNSKWVILDSCKETSNSRPVALKYLEEIGVNYIEDVKLIIISHWHDDHIEGLSEIVEVCKNARVSFPLSFTREEFTTYVNARHHNSTDSKSGVSELFNTIKLTTKKVGRDRNHTNTIPAFEGMTVWEDNDDPNMPISIRSLSPSPYTFQLFLDELIEFLNKPEDHSDPVKIRQDQNDHSTVMSVTVGGSSILLGGDLPLGTKEENGWRAILNINNWLIPKANIFKVPHHGSHTSYSPDIWDKLTKDNPIALMSPKNSCKNPPPTEEDISNVGKHTEHIYCTCSPTGWKPKRVSTKFQRDIDEYIEERKRVTGKMGHIRVRFPYDTLPVGTDVAICENACQLSPA